MEKFYVVQFPDKDKKQICMILKREEITWRKKIPPQVGAEVEVGKNGIKATIVGKGDDQMQLLSLIGKKIGAGTGKAKPNKRKRKGLRSDKGKEDESETKDEPETRDESGTDDDFSTGITKKKDLEALTRTQNKSVKELEKKKAPKVSDEELWDDEDEDEKFPLREKQVSAKGKGSSQTSATESHENSDEEPGEKRKPEIKKAEEAAEEKLDSELQEHEAVLQYVTKTEDNVRLVENGRLLVLELDRGEMLKSKSKKSILATVSTAIRKCYKNGPHMIEYSAVGQKKKKLPFVEDIIKFCRFIEERLGVAEDEQIAAHLITTRINNTLNQMAKKEAE